MLMLAAILVAASPAPRVFDQLRGTWSCSTAAGSSVSDTFSIGANGGIRDHLEWRNGTTTGSFDQSFSYDAQSDTWHVHNVGSNGIVFDGTSHGTDGNVAVITGTQTVAGTTAPVRERYIFESPKSFSHVWEAKAADGTWSSTSYSQCSLVQPGTP
jgi:hypothetical protein